MVKTTLWVKIKAEYLQGATPAELGKKYGLTAKQISDKANKEKWTTDKSKICEEVRDHRQETGRTGPDIKGTAGSRRHCIRRHDRRT